VDIGAAWREGRGLSEVRDGGVVVVGCQSSERFGQRFVRGVFRFLSQRGGGNQAKRCKSDLRLPLV